MGCIDKMSARQILNIVTLKRKFKNIKNRIYMISSYKFQKNYIT